MNAAERKKVMAKVKINLLAIRAVLDRKVSTDNHTEVQTKLIDLIEISGLAAHTESLAKTCYDEEVADLLFILALDNDYKGMGSMALKDIAKGKSAEYLGASAYAERLGRNITHATEGLRTIISMAKQEMSQRKYSETV